MKISFYLRYHTVFGQSLHIIRKSNEPGNIIAAETIPMQYMNNDFWQAEIEVTQTKNFKILYSYTLIEADGLHISEGENDRVIELPLTGLGEVQVIDTWNFEGAYQNSFYTSPFREVLLAQPEPKIKTRRLKNFTHLFKVKAPVLKKNEVIGLAGSSLALGDWKKEETIFLSKEGNWWTAKVNIPHESFPLQYKYILYNTREKKVVAVETGENRHLYGNPSASTLSIIHDGFARFQDNTWKGTGTSIPVSSLKSINSFGVGEFTDLRLLIDWAREVDLKLIQLLPINDTSATFTSADSYPYAAISAFALHPIYINLEIVAGKKNAAIIKKLRKKQTQLNETPVLDYQQVMQFKMSALKELFNEQKEDYIKDTAFYEFFTRNRHWLVPYAAFCNLRDKNGTADSSQWKTNREYNKEAIEKYVLPKSKHYDDVFFQYYVQYHLHLQLTEASEYAHKKGIILKGDIPIGVYRYSCDAWTNPELFNMDMQAGAPPDDFAVKGQNWGFPTYNWQKMQEDGFAWWRQRFEQMSSYFDAFRIDHILGFFRIWSIPIDAVEGIMGYFVPAIAVNSAEFAAKQMPFERNRFVKPFIVDETVDHLFGEWADAVRQEYLSEGEAGIYQLKEAFDTQRKVEAYFAGLEQTAENIIIKAGLFDCISNVILFAASNATEDEFHFRIDMEKTSSFLHLNAHT
ncbi:MAG: 4-alpha-glucanotransferase, partial [Chitinophagaceae bacterium]